MKIKQKGYTLIEILVVVIIIGILSYISLPIYHKTIQRSKVSDALHDIDMLTNAEIKHFMKRGQYTDDLSNLETPLTGESETISTKNFVYSAGDIWKGNYCIYAESKDKSFKLARNYKTNSEILCSGSYCNKLNGLVNSGSLTDMCGGPHEGHCDKTCPERGTLNVEECQCECEPCGKYAVLDSKTCRCLCVGRSYPDGRSSCICALRDDICQNDNGNENFVVNMEKCTCECGLDEKKCEEQYGENFVFDKKGCSCVCGPEAKCDEGFIWSQGDCACIPK